MSTEPAQHPPATAQERDAMLAEIHASFADVTRAGGVSWSQAYVHDIDYIVRAPIPDDPDKHWRELVDDPKWRIDPGLGGFSFLDPIGFRYYLAAALCRMVNKPDGEDILFHLTLDARGDFVEYRLNKWSELNDQQRRTVARFLAYMDGHQEQPPEDLLKAYAFPPSDLYPWRHALNSYWRRFLEDPPTTASHRSTH